MKIVAIGGGEIGRPGTQIETESIDREIIALTGKQNPKLLFLPTASTDSESYYDVIKGYFGARLGCQTDVLYLIKEKPSFKEIEDKILGSDIVYVGGGDTKMMLEVWSENKVDEVLKKAAEKGVVLSGVSAGAICWFKYGNSDSKKFENGSTELIKIEGLGLIDLMACPHYDAEENRKPSLVRMIVQEGGMAVALENCTAFELVDGKYRILFSKESPKAYRLFRKGTLVVQQYLPKDGKFRKIEELIKY